jgi:hypothetical protein
MVLHRPVECTRLKGVSWQLAEQAQRIVAKYVESEEVVEAKG